MGAQAGWRVVLLLLLGWNGPAVAGEAEAADVILHNANVVTVDEDFSIHQAVAIRGDRIVAVGGDDEVLVRHGRDTVVHDLDGRTVLPGLMDSHTHPAGASMHEFDHPVPTMRNIADVLDYVRGRAETLEAGEWIRVQQVFITRLEERRYPTRAELDEAAPENPVMFRTGPDASLNTPALERSGIDRDFEIDDGGAGHVERDPQTGEPTGIIRSMNRYVRYEAPASARRPTAEDRYERMAELLNDYASVGLTAIADRNASRGAIELYEQLLEHGDLLVRVAASHAVGTGGETEAVRRTIREIADHPLRGGDAMLRIVGIKVFLDGGMLTGSAYMREPWGVSEMYAIDDPEYRGHRFIEPDKLEAIVAETVEQGMQFTAHSVGDGAVHALLDAYAAVEAERPIAQTRPSITHCNFMSAEAIEQMAELGVVADIQPPWLYLDTRTLSRQFGTERLRYFQPLASLFAAGVVAGGGSDHMQKIGSRRSVNPYDPWLGMWITLTRQPLDYPEALHPVEALTREQALRFYTGNNAHILFLDEAGSLEPGKLADLIVIDRDVLSVPVDEIKETRVLRTYVGGELVYER